MQPPSFKQIQTPSQSLKQSQHLMMTPAMQQALNFLTLPIMELQPLIDQEMEQNPVLEYEELENEIEEPTLIPEEEELHLDENDYRIMQDLSEEFREHFSGSEGFKKREPLSEDKLQFLESLVTQTKTLFTHLMEQSLETFENKEELKIAEAIIGNFDESGFLKISLEEIALLNGMKKASLEPVLETIKTFEPKGVGASNLQESLLIQLELLGKEDSLAYKIIKQHYDDLVHHRIPLIKKMLKISEKMITETISKDISKLDLHPASGFQERSAPYIVPDVTIKEDGEEWVVFVNDDPLPPLKLNARYLGLLNDPSLAKETKDFIKKKIASAKWLLKNLTQRNETLVSIAHALVKKQKEFLQSPDGKLKPCTMGEIANDLQLHESTVARAVSNKYIYTPRGLQSLRSFFTTSYAIEDGEDISSETVKNQVLEIIKGENKKKPLSDEAISKMLKSQGIPCARRTIAKYRYALNLGNAQQRRVF